MEHLLAPDRPLVEFDRGALHAALCRGLDVSLGYGSQSAVARKLDTTQQWYHRVLRGEGTIEQAAAWCAIAGVRIVIEDGVATFDLNGEVVQAPADS